nr:TlpA disulfide reductase family protein [uncultured Pseudomonas sp.]
MYQSELIIGDLAPQLRLNEFIKGEPFEIFAPETVYVIEFWATWCGPCQRAIPHLTALQCRYPAVVVLGVAVAWDTPEEVRAFVETRGEAMGYRVALDLPALKGQRNWTRATWCDASYQLGIPSSFIVDRAGRVVWMGHPLDLDASLDAVVSGDFDLEGHALAHVSWLQRNKIRESWALKRKIGLLRRKSDRFKVLSLYKEALDRDPELLAEHGLNQLKLMLEICPPKALTFSEMLISEYWNDDANLIYGCASALLAHIESEPTVKDEFSVHAATLACSALKQVEYLLGPMETIGALQFTMLQARAHLKVGDLHRALGLATHALNVAKLLPADNENYALALKLLQRCQHALD